MIKVEDALVVAAEREIISLEKVDETDFTDRERTQLDYLDSMVESSVYKSFNGGVFEFVIPTTAVEPKVIEALKCRYEAGGWKVGAFLVKNDAGEATSYQVVFAPSRLIAKSDSEPPREKVVLPKTLPPVASIDASGGGRPRLLVRMPTRARPAQALAVLEAYRKMAGCPIKIEVVVDEDDVTMLRAEVVQRLAALSCTLTVGRHESKVAACNGGKVSEWDVLVLASDDMWPVADGYAARILSAMDERWPHLDGAIFFNDGWQKSNLCTLPIFGRRLYDQFGYVYAPQYKSLFCDREQTDLLCEMGRLFYVDEKIIEHRHHVWGRSEKDALYERNDALESADKAVYEEREATVRPYSQFMFDSPPIWLSILICTVPERRAQLDWLLEHLWAQILSSAEPREVEVLIDSRVEPSVGEKRQALLERAKGRFVSFVDDDDGLAHGYLERVVGALRANPEVDCASLEGVITTGGANPQRFTHSIHHDGWYTRDDVHYRTTNHLNATRRDLAIQVGFVPKNIGEDFEFSKRLRPLLKTEASTGTDPWYYYWYNPAKSVQSVKR